MSPCLRVFRASGDLTTDTPNTTGNAAVGGNLAVGGVASTNRIDNNGQVISGVANGVAAMDAANVGQVNTVVSNAVAAQSVVNSRVQGQLDENRKNSMPARTMAAKWGQALAPCGPGKALLG